MRSMTSRVGTRDHCAKLTIAETLLVSMWHFKLSNKHKQLDNHRNFRVMLMLSHKWERGRSDTYKCAPITGIREFYFSPEQLDGLFRLPTGCRWCFILNLYWNIESWSPSWSTCPVEKIVDFRRAGLIWISKPRFSSLLSDQTTTEDWVEAVKMALSLTLETEQKDGHWYHVLTTVAYPVNM